MGYTLEALIASTAVFAAVPPSLMHVKVVSLAQGLSLVPVTGELHDELGLTRAKPFEEFWLLSQNLAEFAATLSQQGKVVYVEADYFGGVGTQATVGWHRGHVDLGPLYGEGGAINEALRWLGIKRDGFLDEFEAVGLRQHRETEAWAER
jgi:hypothetical protein